MEHPRPRCILLAPRGWEAPSGGPEDPPLLFGLHPVERTVLAFLRVGVGDFVIVGEARNAARVEHTLRLGRCRRARIRTLGPGESVRKLLEDGGPCFVARCDFLYDRRLVARFVEETAAADATVASVDFRSDALDSQEAAARVATWRTATDVEAGPVVRAAARGIVAPDGVLTGLARVNPSFGRAWEDAPYACRSLENALTLLARREPVAAWSVTETWHAVRAEPALRDADLVLARRKVLASAVGVSDGVIARHLNRPLSRRITERIVSRDVKPWQLSVASFLATLGAGLSFAVGHATTGGLIAQMASILDGVDGEVARIRYQDSAFGGVYDALLDRVGDAALIGGMTLYAWVMGAGHSAVALGFGAVAGSSLSMLVKEKYGTQFQRPYHMEHEGRWNWLLLGRDGRLFLTLVAGITGYVEAVLAYLALGTHLHAGVRLYRIRAEATAAA